MIRRIFYLLVFAITVSSANAFACNSERSSQLIETSIQAPNNGTYMRTQYTVDVYTESGHKKGSFTVYLHQGKKYISFNRTWICIQGKNRFFYSGNWYVIK